MSAIILPLFIPTSF